jgi:hypothetical protein
MPQVTDYTVGLIAPCASLRLLVPPERLGPKADGWEPFPRSAHFHRIHGLTYHLVRLPEVAPLLGADGRAAVAAFDAAYDALPWRPLASHPHMSELPGDDLSPLFPAGRRLLRVLERRRRRLARRAWFRRALAFLRLAPAAAG